MFMNQKTNIVKMALLFIFIYLLNTIYIKNPGWLFFNSWEADTVIHMEMQGK